MRQVNGSERLHTLWPLEYGAKAVVNLFLLTCKLLKGGKIQSDEKNNIMIESSNGNIILDLQIETQDGWVARSEFLHERKSKRALMSKQQKRKILMLYILS